MPGNENSGHEKRSTLIIRRQEALGLKLLDHALNPNSQGQEKSIDILLDVFEKVGKWVSIKNRLDDQGETQIDEFKRRIHGETTLKAAPGRARRIRETQEHLAAIKQRLANRGNSNSNGDIGDSGE